MQHSENKWLIQQCNKYFSSYRWESSSFQGREPPALNGTIGSKNNICFVPCCSWREPTRKSSFTLPKNGQQVSQLSRERRREWRRRHLHFNYRQGKQMLAELSTQKYRGCSKLLWFLVFFKFLPFFPREERRALCFVFVFTQKGQHWGNGGGRRRDFEIMHEKEHEMCPRVCSTSSPTQIHAWLRVSRLCVWILSASWKQPWGVSSGVERLSHRNHHWLVWIHKCLETCWLRAKAFRKIRISSLFNSWNP